jgi:large subunit ribosomal protein L25
MALQCDAAELHNILAEAGKTRLIGLKLDKAKKPRNVLIRETQREPRTGKLLHVDFYQVRMAEKMKVEVPIDLVGEAPALKAKGTMLMHELNSLDIECLPEDIPASVELDISILTEAEQVIHVKDIILGKGISVLSDPEHIVARISVLPTEKMEEEEEAAEAPEEVSEAEDASEEESKDE